MQLNNRLRHTNNVLGFTLVEILVVIFILGILAALAIPSLGEWIAKARVRSGIEDLQSALQLAQSEAAKRNRSIEFSLLDSQPVPTEDDVLDTAAVDDGSYWAVRILPIDDETDKIFVRGGNFGSRGVKITGDGTLIFNGTGGVLTDATPTYLATTRVYRVVSKTDQFPMCVLVRPGGGIRWCDPNVSSGVVACPTDVICPN